jgi:hypothetical protein
MSSGDTAIKAVLTHHGRVLIEQPDDSFCAAEARTDWQRVDAMSEEAIERNAAEEMAELGIDPGWPDHARLVFPRPRPGSPCASIPRCSVLEGARQGEIPWD